MSSVQSGRLDDLLKQLDADDENLSEDDFDYDEFMQRRVTQSQVVEPLNEDYGDEDEGEDKNEQRIIDAYGSDNLSDEFDEVSDGVSQRDLPNGTVKRGTGNSENVPSARQAGLWVSDGESEIDARSPDERDALYAEAGIDPPEKLAAMSKPPKPQGEHEDIERVNQKIEREIDIHISRHTVAEATVEGFAALLGHRTPPPSPGRTKNLITQVPKRQDLTSFVASSPPRPTALNSENDAGLSDVDDDDDDDLEIVPTTKASRMNAAERDQALLGHRTEAVPSVGNLIEQLMSKQRDQARARRKANQETPNPPRRMESVIEHERQVTTNMARNAVDKFVSEGEERRNSSLSVVPEEGDEHQISSSDESTPGNIDPEVHSPNASPSQKPSTPEAITGDHYDETQEDLRKVKEMGLSESQELAEVRRLFLSRRERERDRTEAVEVSQDNETSDSVYQASGDHTTSGRRKMVSDESSDSEASDGEMPVSEFPTVALQHVDEDDEEDKAVEGSATKAASEESGEAQIPSRQVSQDAVGNLVNYVQQESRKRRRESRQLKSDTESSFVKPTRIAANEKTRAFFESCTGSFVKKPKAASSRPSDVLSIHESLKFLEPADRELTATDDNVIPAEERVILPRARPLPSLRVAPPQVEPYVLPRSVARIQSELAPSGPKTVQVLKSTSRPRQPVESRPKRVVQQLKTPKPAMQTSHIRGSIFRRNWDS